jgi:hypothetical protein
VQDSPNCPICNNKLRVNHLNNFFLHPTGKISNYTEKVCSNGYSHIFISWFDNNTKTLDLIKFSLKPDYNKYVQIDFINQTTLITVINDLYYEHKILVKKIIVPDFPLLMLLKDKINVYLTFD